MSWIILRFADKNPGLWYMHCHINWHMQAGLMLLLHELPSQQSSTTSVTVPIASKTSKSDSKTSPKKEIPNHDDSNVKGHKNTHPGVVGGNKDKKGDNQSNKGREHMLLRERNVVEEEIVRVEITAI